MPESERKDAKGTGTDAANPQPDAVPAEVTRLGGSGGAGSGDPPLEQAGAKPKKKPYYSPSEVMKKKGCIGCGGMLLAVLVLAVGLVVLAIL